MSCITLLVGLALALLLPYIFATVMLVVGIVGGAIVSLLPEPKELIRSEWES